MQSLRVSLLLLAIFGITSSSRRSAADDSVRAPGPPLAASAWMAACKEQLERAVARSDDPLLSGASIRAVDSGSVCIEALNKEVMTIDKRSYRIARCRSPVNGAGLELIAGKLPYE